jgi:hypothetical protein
MNCSDGGENDSSNFSEEDHETEGEEVAEFVKTRNNKKFDELVNAGFRPPLSFKSAGRATKRKMSLLESNSSDTSSIVDVTENSRRDTASENDGEKCAAMAPLSPKQNSVPNPENDETSFLNIGLSKITQKLDVSEKTAKRVIKRKHVSTCLSVKIDEKLALSKQEEPPLQLFHRLFEPIGGKAKRKYTRSNKDATSSKKKQRCDSSNVGAVKKNPRKVSIVQSSSSKVVADVPSTKQHPAVVLPPNAVIRGSIIHKVLHKLNRLDLTSLYDDPWDNLLNDKQTESEKAAAQVSTPLLDDDIGYKSNGTLEKTDETAPSNSCQIDTSNTQRTHSLDMVIESDRPVQQRTKIPLRVRVRSAVLPQKSKMTSRDKYRVIICQGPLKGQTGKSIRKLFLSDRSKICSISTEGKRESTDASLNFISIILRDASKGYIVDEIDGTLSVIQSDDPNLEDVVKWTVSNLIISTVTELREEKQHASNPPETMVAPKQSEEELFLACLKKEFTSIS